MRDQGLDLIRALAILAVLLLHTLNCVEGIPAEVARVFNTGWAGVDLFFVLSGFLIGGQAIRSDEPAWDWAPVRRFWIRRWFRTLPLYFLVLGFYAGLKPALLGYPFNNAELWPFFVFLQNFRPLTDFVQSWSLCIEEQFYVVFPLLGLFLGLRSRGAWIWLLPAVMSFSLRFLRWKAGAAESVTEAEFDALFRFPTQLHLDGITTGVFLAATQATWRRWMSSGIARIASLVAGGAVIAGTLATTGHSIQGFGAVWYATGLSAGFALLLISLSGVRLPRAIGPGVEWIALLSYGAYLWNNVLIRVLARKPVPGPWWLGVLVFVAGSLAIAWVTYIAVEKPFLRARDLLLARPSFARSRVLSG